MNDLMILSERLKTLRKERRIYQREMAELLDVTLQHYQKIEYGKINISVLTLCTLADHFGVTLDYLMGRTDER